jgi:replicative DNA helicase
VTEDCYKGENEAESLHSEAEADLLRPERTQGRRRAHLVTVIELEAIEVERLITEKKGLTGHHGVHRHRPEAVGMQAGDLIILAARPSMGKTSLA